nr:helix-turn-helix transcriptional regulator [Caulobacter sp. 17J65-9]
MSGEESRAIAARVREALARRRMSRQGLADAARISVSTLEKALAGSRPFTLATTLRIEQALGVTLRAAAPVEAGPRAAGVAPDDLGAYARAAVSWLEGDYLTLRPSFEAADALYAYRTEIAWDEAAACLAFREAARLDAGFTQKGRVSLPHQSGHVYLLTNEHGQVRLITLARPTITGELYGLLSTLQAGPGSHLTPVAAPIALIPLARLSEPSFGRIGPDHAAHADYRERLARVAGQGFARFVAG